MAFSEAAVAAFEALSAVSEALVASATVRAAADASCSAAVSVFARRLAVCGRGSPDGLGCGQGSLGRDDVGVIVSDCKSPLGSDSVGLIGRRAFCRDPRVEALIGGPMLEDSCLVLHREGDSCSR